VAQTVNMDEVHKQVIAWTFVVRTLVTNTLLLAIAWRLSYMLQPTGLWCIVWGEVLAAAILLSAYRIHTAYVHPKLRRR